MACTVALAADLILGRDRFAMRFIKDYQDKQGV
jgi:hypothetical protein